VLPLGFLGDALQNSSIMVDTLGICLDWGFWSGCLFSFFYKL